MTDTVHTTLWASDIVQAWDGLGDAIQNYHRRHPSCRHQENRIVEARFKELAQLMRDALSETEVSRVP